MPIKVACTECGVTLSTPDSSAGRRGKCPQCGSAISIPAVEDESYLVEPLAAEPVSTEKSTDEQRRPCPSCGEMILPRAIKCRFCGKVFDESLLGALGGTGQIDREAWGKVRSGLAMFYNCVGIMVGMIVLIVVASVATGAMSAGPRNADPPVPLMIAMVIAGFLILGASIGMLVGIVRCTNVPQESGAHGVAVGAVMCLVGNILLSLAGGAANSEALTAIGSLMSLVGWILFIVFIKRSATYLRDHELAASVKNYLILIAGIFVGGISLGVLSVIGQPWLLGIVALCVVVGSLISFLWFLRLVRGLRNAIDASLEGTQLGAFA